MAISPQKFREIVFQLLYSSDFGDVDEEEVIQLLMHELAVSKRIVREANEKKGQVEEKKAEIDPLIAQQSKTYDFERIPRVERNILRLGVYELMYSRSVPPKVAIAEAIRLSRKFATPEAAAFVNAILDGLYQTVVMNGLQPIPEICIIADS